MTEPEPGGSCHVALLVPHPKRLALLMAADPAEPGSHVPPRARLPMLQMPGAEPLLSEILDAVDAVDVVDTDTTAVLRQVITSTGEPEHGPPDEDADVSLLVEFEAYASEPPSGWRWQQLDTEVIARLEPETSRAAVAAWTRERDEGWSPQRPPWSRPGWFTRASTWMVEQMAADDRPALGRPRQHQLWGISAILRAPSADGDVYLKCSGDIFRHEAVATQALAREMPDRLPDVIAVDARRGWLLMRDLGAPELGDQDEQLWHEGVLAHAAVQRLWSGRSDELSGLGLPVRSLVDLATEVEGMAIDTVLLGRMPAALRQRWSATAATLVESCRRLDELGPPPSLVHGDFHPWNVVHGDAGTRIFDWTDAAVSHPFVDLATYVFRTRDVSVRGALVEAYVRAWSELGPAESLREAAALGLVVGALYQVQTYRALLPTLMDQGADDGLRDADLDWINRSLTRHELGLTSPV